MGSGKRTLATQIAIQLATNDTKLKIKIVKEKNAKAEFEDLVSRHSTVIIIHEPLKPWYTARYTEEIMNYLSKLCTIAKTNKSYIIAIFHCKDWDLFKKHLGDKNSAKMERMFPKRKNICNDKNKKTEVAKLFKINVSKVADQKGGTSIGEFLKMTLYLKHQSYQEDDFLKTPVIFIFNALKKWEESDKIYEQFLFKVMVFIVLHDGEIAKWELNDISQHALFIELKNVLNVELFEKAIKWCIEMLLQLFIEETTDERSYRIMHDVITRCTFLAALQNNKRLLFLECSPILIFDCICEKWKNDKKNSDFIEIDIGVPAEIYPDLARFCCQRSEMERVLRNNKLYDNEIFLKEYKKAEVYFMSQIHVENDTVL